MARDPELRAHQEWLGYLQPVGLVVSPPGLLAAQAHINKNIVPEHTRFLDWVEEVQLADGVDPVLAVTDLPGLLENVFDWEPNDLIGHDGSGPLPDELELVLADYNETLRPTYAVEESERKDESVSRWQMLIQVVETATELDEFVEQDGPHWPASPQARFERLLREKEIPIGLLVNGTHLRLVYAPRGETSGHLTFPVQAMSEVSGRSIFAALHLLLSADRMFSLPKKQRLPAILEESRKYQNEVSKKLADQVLGALWDLLRGFQAADGATSGRIVDRIAKEDPDHIYGGLLTVIMRLVFVLYAEDRGLMPNDPVYMNNYSLTKLYDRLREDAGHYPDTMDQRYGAWAWLLSLFRLVFDGGGHGNFHLPTRHGQLFNPDEYPFLEGRPQGINRVMGDRFEAPLVSDGCIYRALQGLLVLDGERLSYRALDVEQIGSVYEAMMGFEVERATGRSIGVRRRKQGMDLDIVFNVQELLEVDPSKRKKWLKDQTECDLTGKAATELKDAQTPEDVVAALGKKISPRTPRLLPPGALYLQPGEERRRSGSHYTPRELTEPIVRTTLRPVLEALGDKPTPEQILELKVCDPAMGSGAFLVEASRQLAERLVEAWDVHDCTPEVPPDEDPLLHARRLVVQRCLYGVDKNPFAVNLAKLSLWLATLAKDHAFTFIDHALKYGDSLVGLTQNQIAAFHWKPKSGKQIDWIEEQLRVDLEKALGWRDALQDLDEGDYIRKKEAWREAENALADARLIGDLAVAAFFGAEKDKKREELRNQYRGKVEAWRADTAYRHELEGIVQELRDGEKPVPPFHWEIEFPEVFGRENPGFDTMVGNPPFLGGKKISTIWGDSYREWLATLHFGASSNADLVAHFFRIAFHRLRHGGSLGLVATNSIAQGATRKAGLSWIAKNGGTIFCAIKRYRWPGQVAVVVSIVHVRRGPVSAPYVLDYRDVSTITAFLFHAGTHDNPVALGRNRSMSYIGYYVLGMGFTFDDNDKTGFASSIKKMRELVAEDPRNSQRIFEYIGGAELNSNPTYAADRYVINFGDMSERDARRWPDLMELVERNVKPERLRLKRKSLGERWWQFAEKQPALVASIEGMARVLVSSQVCAHLSFVFLPSHIVFSHKLTVFPLDTNASFCALQSRTHELWTRFFSGTAMDLLRYTPSDCFETFPFPENWQDNAPLEATGEAYYEFRAELMVRNDEGLTKTYNRFHNPEERDPEILKLRELHAAMDRAVLDAYGWDDISTDCEFLLDYEIDEDTWGTKKKPYRYRWPEEVHDEVLARLLDLNQKRAEEEQINGIAASSKSKKAIAKPRKRKKKADQSGELF